MNRSVTHRIRPPEGAAELRLEVERCRAGDEVGGRVDGERRGALVTLARVECRPCGVRRIVVAEAQSSPADGRFVVRVPETALPTVAGERCALVYRASVDGLSERFPGLIVDASAVPHVDAGSWRPDRLLRDYDARHFHIELFDADLRGGGRLEGRVHRHRCWPAGTLRVTARCTECWRASPFAERGTPLWQEAIMWEETHTLSVAEDSHWAPFRFELPADLPPAVEARTIAWRYELLARGNVHRWLRETAALTPLLHEEDVEKYRAGLSSQQLRSSRRPHPAASARARG